MPSDGDDEFEDEEMEEHSGSVRQTRRGRIEYLESSDDSERCVGRLVRFAVDFVSCAADSNGGGVPDVAGVSPVPAQMWRG